MLTKVLVKLYPSTPNNRLNDSNLSMRNELLPPLIITHPLLWNSTHVTDSFAWKLAADTQENSSMHALIQSQLHFLWIQTSDVTLDYRGAN